MFLRLHVRENNEISNLYICGWEKISLMARFTFINSLLL